MSATNGAGQYDAVDRRRRPQRPRRRLLPGDAPACGRSCCERREIVGGCCVTEEFAPGYRASTGAYVLSMLREPVWRDMRLVERGIDGRPGRPVAEPVRRRLAPAPRRRPRRRRRRDRAASRPPTPRALPEFEDELGRARRADHAADRHDAARPARLRRAATCRAAWLGGARGAQPRRGSPTRCTCSPPRRPSTSTSASRATTSGRRSAGTRSTTRLGGPSTPGHRATSCSTTTPPRRPAAGSAQWGFVRGGIGRGHRGDGRRGARGRRRRSAPRPRSSAILVEDGARRRASCWTSGERGARAARALQRRPEDDLPAAGRRTARCPTDFRAAVAAYRCEGTSMKINLAVDRLPVAAGDRRRRASSRTTAGSWRSTRPLAEMDRGQAEARAGQPGGRPPHRALLPDRPRPLAGARRPSRGDDRRQLAALHARRGHWDELRDEVADRAIGEARRLLPRPRGLDRRTARCSAPLDLERGSGSDRRPRAARRDGASTSSSTCARSAAGPTTAPRSTASTSAAPAPTPAAASPAPTAATAPARSSATIAAWRRSSAGRGDEPPDPGRSGSRSRRRRWRSTRPDPRSREILGADRARPPIRA